MASQSLTNFAAALKTLYPDRAIEDLTYPLNTFFALVKKSNDFYGENKKIPVHIGDVSGANSAFASAQSNKNGTVKKAFFLTRKPEYALASIDNELIEASASNAGAFVSALKSEMDSAIRIAGRRIGQACYRDGSGQLATISSTTNTATTTLGLTNPDDIVNFYLNQDIVFAANNTSALRTATTLTVNAIDEDAGTMTLSATPDSLSASIAAGDAIFTDGDYASASDRNRATGLDGWLPSTAPGTSDSFFSVDRSVHPTRLGGHRITGTSLQIDEAIYKGAVRVARAGGKPDKVFIAHGQYEILQNVLGSKVQYYEHNVGEIAFAAIRMHGPAGPLDVYPDYNCLPDAAFVLDFSSWELCSLNKAPHILGLHGGDGLRLLRDASADSSEVRVGAYFNLGCTAPGHNCRVSLTAPS